MGTGGLVWSRMHGDVQDAWQAGVVVCSRQSDKVKPLPCTLTEVFHATAAWRQNPTKTAGITFQTGMPVDNVRPPVISITIIRGDLGLHQPCTSVPTSFLPPPTPPLPLRGLDDLSTRRTNPSCHHQQYPSGPDGRRCAVQPSAVQTQPRVQGQSQQGNAQWLSVRTLPVCVGVWMCEMLSEIMRRRARRSALCRLDRIACDVR